MKTNLYAHALGAALLFSLPLSAQISFGGAPIGLKAEKLGLPKVERHTLPSVDASALMAEDAARAEQGIKGPYRFGFNHTVDLSMENSGTWSELADGTRLWRIRVECPGALSINFVFGEYVVPEGAKVFVFNDAGKWLGAFTQSSSGGALEMGVTQISGDAITVEYQAPAHVLEQGRLRITQVTHAYRDVMGLLKGLGDSGACNNNVICPEGDDWRNEIASVAMITVGGNGICTGSLINNCANDGTPYFLTANHCTQGANVGTWSFRFNWESPTCTPTTNGPTNQTVSGSSLLVNNAGSDVALLELNTAPPTAYNVFYAGWDASGATPSSQTCVHHPSGDIKKISFDNNAAAPGAFGGAQCWHILAWDDGTTEPGSSGSGLWNQDHRLIGQLFGGTASCGNNVDDYFGRMDVSFPLLNQWLGTCGTTLDGWSENSTPLGLDASLNNLSGINDSYCNANTITPSITLKNMGTTTLNSVTYTYNLDGGANTANVWNGVLTTGATQVISLGSIPVSNGPHTFNAFVSAPNSGSDENAGNDTRAKTFYVADPGGSILLNITLDDYGSETTWTLATEGGTSLFTGGPYADDIGGTVITETLCVGTGCYVLNMIDAYGDGICCDFGDGDYEVIGAGSEVLVTGDGAFLDNVETPFCLVSTGVGTNSGADAFRIFPNPGNGQFHVVLPAGDGSTLVRLRDMLGREVWQQSMQGVGPLPLDLAKLADGQYALEISAGEQRTMRMLTIAR
jgi:lysyl endopeptidase